MLPADAIKQLEDLDPACEIVMQIWQAEDVEHQAAENNHDLTQEQVNDVLAHLEKYMDSNEGICRITVDCAIDEILSRSKS